MIREGPLMCYQAGFEMSDDEIFEKALQLPIEEREQYLMQTCEGDADQLARLRKLLEAERLTDSLLDPAMGDSTQEHLPDTSLDMVGNYQLLQQIGEGGFGVVYMAAQTKPVRRKVAVKIVKPGMDSKAVLARFDAERQALAMMDHPNIATVFDGGVSELGRPYFVMELVKGVPITTYCDDNQLGTRGRLELFVAVCKAVQHAHTKGIVHRDIKPSNVLVTLHDGTPVVKVIDFGVAKAMHVELTEQTLFTAFGQMIGTPQYMSPEQAEMSGLDIDTRSDVYSLGVMLYELLTGTTPLENEAIRGASYLEIQRLIRETESPRPSARISSSADRLTHIAKHRSIDPNKLSDEIRGDLDWIVMKSLEKDRSRRYETADQFARDVQHHLDDEIVSARPPSRRYQLQRFVRKQRALILTVSTVLFSLLIFVAALGYLLIEKNSMNLTLQAERDRYRDLLTEVAVTHALGGNLEQAQRVAQDMYGPDARAEKSFIDGVAKFYGGDEAGAVQSLNESCRIDSQNVAANAMLAIIFEWQGEFVNADVAWNKAKNSSTDQELGFHDEFFFAYAQAYRDPKAGIAKMHEIVEQRHSPIAQAQLAVLIGESMMGAEDFAECRENLVVLTGPEGPLSKIENAKTSLGRTNKWVEICDLFIRCVYLRNAQQIDERLPADFLDNTEALISDLPAGSQYPITLVLKRIWYGLQDKTPELIQVMEQQGVAGRMYFADHVRYLRGERLMSAALEQPRSLDSAFRMMLHCYLDEEFASKVRARWKTWLAQTQNSRISLFILWLGLLTDDAEVVKEQAAKTLAESSIPESEQKYFTVKPILRNLAGDLPDDGLRHLAESNRASEKVVFDLQLALKRIRDPSRHDEALEQLDKVISANVPWLYCTYLAEILKRELLTNERESTQK